MTNVLSIRLPVALERVIGDNAARSKMPVAEIVRLILEHSIDGQYSFPALRDIPQSLDAKLDVRLPADLITRIRAASQRFQVSISVYSRVILFAYYTKRLIFVEIGGRYTLAENHEQKKSA